VGKQGIMKTGKEGKGNDDADASDGNDGDNDQGGLSYVMSLQCKM